MFYVDNLLIIKIDTKQLSAWDIVCKMYVDLTFY